jgi:hypothetical protein
MSHRYRSSNCTVTELVLWQLLFVAVLWLGFSSFLIALARVSTFLLIRQIAIIAYDFIADYCCY